MPRSHLSLLAAFALVGCAPTPSASPAAGFARVDLVTIGTPGNGDVRPMGFQSRDLARIRAILEIIRGPGDWDGSWHTFPAGKVHLGFQSGDRSLGAAWFGEEYLIARADTTTKMRSITRAEYDSLLKLTVWWPPTPGDYVTFDTLTGPPAPIDYSADPDARRFRSQLEGTRIADLAGHFAVVTWGCGTACLSHMVLDLRTGRPYTDTLLDPSCGTITHDRSSALVIVYPANPGSGCRRRGTRYLAWEGTRFAELATPWAFEDTLSVMAERPARSAADSALESSIAPLLPLADSAVGRHTAIQTAVARLASGEVVPIDDPDHPPADAETLFGFERDSSGSPVRAWEAPVSQSGDGVIYITHYFDRRGRTIAIEQYGGYITGCALAPADSGGEEVLVSAGETATWIFDSSGTTVAKHYRRRGGDDQGDLTHETNCNTSYQIVADKYRTASAWLVATGLRALVSAAH